MKGLKITELAGMQSEDTSRPRKKATLVGARTSLRDLQGKASTMMETISMPPIDVRWAKLPNQIVIK